MSSAQMSPEHQRRGQPNNKQALITHIFSQKHFYLYYLCEYYLALILRLECPQECVLLLDSLEGTVLIAKPNTDSQQLPTVP